jgi:hypothetical protein
MDQRTLGAGRCINPDRCRVREVMEYNNLGTVISFVHIAHIAHLIM